MRYKGTQGTSIAKIFDLTVAATGNNEKTLRRLGIPYQKSYTTSASHAGYYPGAVPMNIKLLYGADGRILGAQAVGRRGTDKRIVNKLDPARTFLLDVRTPVEFSHGSIPGAVNIPLDELRHRLKEITAEKEIIVYCQIGLRAYIAARILTQRGYRVEISVAVITSGHLPKQQMPENLTENVKKELEY